MSEVTITTPVMNPLNQPEHRVIKQQVETTDLDRFNSAMSAAGADKNDVTGKSVATDADNVDMVGFIVKMSVNFQNPYLKDILTDAFKD